MINIDDEIEAKIMAVIEDYEVQDVFAALYTIAAKMVLSATQGDSKAVSKMFRDSADYWDQISRGAQH